MKNNKWESLLVKSYEWRMVQRSATESARKAEDEILDRIIEVGAALVKIGWVAKKYSHYIEGGFDVFDSDHKKADIRFFCKKWEDEKDGIKSFSIPMAWITCGDESFLPEAIKILSERKATERKRTKARRLRQKATELLRPANK